MTDPPGSRLPPLDPGAVRAVVFDLDGTLVDSYEAIAEALNHARGHYGLTSLSVPEVRLRVGRGLESLIAELVGPDRVDHGVRLFRDCYGEVFAGKTFALPGAVRTLRRLRDRAYRIAVASNKPARFSTPILRRLDIARYIDRVHGPDTVGSHKPEPAMIRACLRDLEVGPEAAVYVGDSVLDVETARRAGLPVLLLSGGSAIEAELRQTGQPVLGSLDEVAELLAGSAARP